jgi:HAD superfamily hydrolase (TIGR01509 family)
VSRPALIFLDDGGVMSDNARRKPQWQRLVAEFLSPRLGGRPAAWAEANEVVFERSWQRYMEAPELAADDYSRYLAFREAERERWLREMCEHVGVAAPDSHACLQLAKETEAYVIPRVRAAFPGAIDAIRELHAQGYTLSTASAESSWDLDSYLKGMGIRELFGARLYGPDLVHKQKVGPQYYSRIFADADVEPSAALVVDDSPEALRWAAQAGATIVLVTSDQRDAHDGQAVIGSLADLPSVLARIERS